jgi:hypothetical protein
MTWLVKKTISQISNVKNELFNMMKWSFWLMSKTEYFGVKILSKKS